MERNSEQLSSSEPLSEEMLTDQDSNIMSISSTNSKRSRDIYSDRAYNDKNKNKRRKAWVWIFFDVRVMENGQRAFCNQLDSNGKSCNTDYAVDSGSTSNLRHHLALKHNLYPPGEE